MVMDACWQSFSGLNPFSRSVLLLGMALMSVQVSASCDQLALDTSQGTVRDNARGLVWSRCLVGQVSSGCLGDGKTLNRAAALSAARRAEIGGISHWRLPTIDELKALYAIGPSCLEAAFPGHKSSLLWSDSLKPGYSSEAWAFDFVNGKAVLTSSNNSLPLLLVANL
ncbi:MAG: DUF1566 domain-containing protein [Gammaproteobacteria bacterium]|nr:DUF1566 domain-containing protein [Gammaproteobacteria bacterium]